MYTTTSLSDGPAGHEATHMWTEGSVRFYFGLPVKPMSILQYTEKSYALIIAENSLFCYRN